jgi:hypothetical protein
VEPVKRSRMACNEPPAAALSPSDMRIMPTRNRPTPPSRTGRTASRVGGTWRFYVRSRLIML